MQIQRMYKPKMNMGGMTKKLPNAVPTTMSAPKPMMAKGGMVKANCGASMKPTQKGKK